MVISDAETLLKTAPIANSRSLGGSGGFSTLCDCQSSPPQLCRMVNLCGPQPDRLKRAVNLVCADGTPCLWLAYLGSNFVSDKAEAKNLSGHGRAQEVCSSSD